MKFSKTNKKAYGMTMDEWAARLAYAGIGQQRKPSRYRSVGVRDADGTFFHSKGEYARWTELQLLHLAGAIKDLRRQVRYDLHAATPDGPMVVGSFRPDFSYIESDTGEVVDEDFKSPVSAADEAYRMRKRHFEAEYQRPVRETMRTKR